MPYTEQGYRALQGMPSTEVMDRWSIMRGMTQGEALEEVAHVWEARPSRPSSLVVYAQHESDFFYSTYSYECPTLLRAAEIIFGMTFSPEWKIRVAFVGGA